jgi:putative colanic acid biosynthesis UDP-glucose lipid carrier transferase
MINIKSPTFIKSERLILRIDNFVKLMGSNITDSQFIRNEKLKESAIRVVDNPLKRIIDIAISVLIIFFILIWLFPIIAILIKLTSNGPVFYFQQRVGLNSRVFRCFKFRTMYVSESIKDFTPTSKEDPRVTKIGSVLRKLNIDEFPQFLNVLLGDMSIVGPRPHPVKFQEEYAKFVPSIYKRQYVKPGITGLAQVNGYRGDHIDVEINKVRMMRRVACDIIYIKHWSVLFDFKIIIKTALQMLVRKTNGY